MRKTTTFSLVVAASAVFGTGSVRAADPAESTTRGAIVLPVGDKVHGALRGGETHELRVHLAKGDVYSFSVNSRKRGDPLTMHLTVLDPSGREINVDARVVHSADSKKISVGPFKAPESGTYVMELFAQGWHGGDYWGTSSVRGSRKTVVRLPGNGALVQMDVAAGSTIRLRSGLLANFTMATPGGEPNLVTGVDPLVAALRKRGLATGETGAYRFGAYGSRAAIEIVKPRWTAGVVEAPTLPDDPTRAARFEWMNGWKAARPNLVQESDPSQTPQNVPLFGPPLAAGATDPAKSTIPLFVGSDISRSAGVGNFLQPIDEVSADSGTEDPPPTDPTQPSVPTPPPPPVFNPRPPASSPPPSRPVTQRDAPESPAPTALGTPTRMASRPALLIGQCSALIGRSGFFAGTAGEAAWRDAPWTRQRGAYPQMVADAILPLGNVLYEPGEPVFGDERDPYMLVKSNVVLLPMASAAHVEGTIVSTLRCFVDGHQVDTSALVTGGTMTVEWKVEGSGQIDTAAWTLEGAWTLGLELRGDSTGGFAVSDGQPVIRFRQACRLNGAETFRVNAVTQTLRVTDFAFEPPPRNLAGGFLMDPLGSVRVTLVAPKQGIVQTFQRRLEPWRLQRLPDGRRWRTKVVVDHTTTVDPSTGVEGVETEDSYVYLLIPSCS